MANSLLRTRKVGSPHAFTSVASGSARQILRTRGRGSADMAEGADSRRSAQDCCRAASGKRVLPAFLGMLGGWLELGTGHASCEPPAIEQSAVEQTTLQLTALQPTAHCLDPLPPRMSADLRADSSSAAG